MKNDESPIERVINPSMRNSHCQPAQPFTPLKWNTAKAKREVTIDVTESDVQKKLNLD
jgi:hypothetical protein